MKMDSEMVVRGRKVSDAVDQMTSLLQILEYKFTREYSENMQGWRFTFSRETLRENGTIIEVIFRTYGFGKSFDLDDYDGERLVSYIFKTPIYLVKDSDDFINVTGGVSE